MLHLAQVDGELTEEEKRAKRKAEKEAEKAAEKERRQERREEQAEERARQKEERVQERDEQAEDRARAKEERAQERAQEQQPAEQPATAQEQPAAEEPAAAEAETRQERRERRERERAQEQQPAEQPATAQEEPAAEEPAAAEAETRQERRERRERERAQEQQPAEQPATAQEEPAAEEPAAAEAETRQERRERRERERAQEQQPAEQPATAQEEPAAEEPSAAEAETRRERRERRERERAQEQQPAEQPATAQEQPAAPVSEDAEQPRDIVRDRPVEEVVREAEREPTSVVSDRLSREDRQRLRAAEERRRERARERRNELIGAAIVGAAVGALVPQLGGTIAVDEGDRIVVERNGRYYVRKDDSALFRDRGDDIRYERLRGGLVREIVTRPNGSQIITVRDAGGNILRRERITRSGERIVLFDTREEDIRRPYRRIDLPRYRVDIPRERYIVSARAADRDLFYDTFMAEPVYEAPRRYSLQDIRDNQEVRGLVRRVDLDTITFETGSAYVSESQVRLLGDIAGGMLDVIDRDPSAVFLIEGHTDAVGSDLYNLTLSDRRAETVARILTEAYDVPPENLVVQGYGEQFLKVETLEAERANRRVAIRNISPILQGAAQ